MPATKKWRRLTYQNGEVYEVIPVTIDGSVQKIMYSSSTDEIKEDSDYIRGALSNLKGKTSDLTPIKDDLNFPLPRTEVYLASLDGHRIERLTQDPGFDGDISLRGKRTELAFVRWEKGTPQAQVFNSSTKNKSFVGHAGSWSSDPVFSPTQDELAWVERQEDGLWLLLTGSAYGKNGKIRYQSSGRIRDLNYHPNGKTLIFSESTKDDTSTNFEIAMYNLVSQCKRRLTYHTGLDLEPVFSPDGNTALFASDRSGVFQIYQIDLKQLPPCP